MSNINTHYDGAFEWIYGRTFYTLKVLSHSISTDAKILNYFVILVNDKFIKRDIFEVQLLL